MHTSNTDHDETLNAIFYNPDHTKRYNPSGKPTGVVLTDFDIMEAKQAIEDLYTEKLEAFAGEVEKAIGIPTQTFHTESGLSDATDTQINIAVDDMITWIKNGGSIDKKEREWFKSRTVEQVPKDLQAKGANLLRKEVLEALKAIKEKAGIE